MLRSTFIQHPLSVVNDDDLVETVTNRPRTRRRVWASIVALVAGFALVGCAQSSGNSDDVLDQGYQSGDGSVRQWVATARGDSVTLTGTDFSGDAVDTGAWRGSVVVVNTWYAACPPCRKEAPGLVATAAQYQDSVKFVGINSTDESGTALAFQRTFGVTYPTIADSDGSVIATLQGVVPIQAVPTTVVLDQQGRVAARVLGEVEPSTLRALIDDVLKEVTATPTATKNSQKASSKPAASAAVAS